MRLSPVHFRQPPSQVRWAGACGRAAVMASEQKPRRRRRGSIGDAGASLGGVRNIVAKAFSLSLFSRRKRRKGRDGAAGGAADGEGGQRKTPSPGKAEIVIRGINSTEFFTGFAGLPTPDNIRGVDFCFEVSTQQKATSSTLHAPPLPPRRRSRYRGPAPASHHPYGLAQLIRCPQH